MLNRAEPGLKDGLAAQIPLGRVGQIEDVMPAVRWLASDQSSWVTGQGIFIDGGLSVP